MMCTAGATLSLTGGCGPVLPSVGGVLQLPPLPVGPRGVWAQQGQCQHQHLHRDRRDLTRGEEQGNGEGGAGMMRAGQGSSEGEAGEW